MFPAWLRNELHTVHFSSFSQQVSLKKSQQSEVASLFSAKGGIAVGDCAGGVSPGATRSVLSCVVFAAPGHLCWFFLPALLTEQSLGEDRRSSWNVLVQVRAAEGGWQCSTVCWWPHVPSHPCPRMGLCGPGERAGSYCRAGALTKFY